MRNLFILLSKVLTQDAEKLKVSSWGKTWYLREPSCEKKHVMQLVLSRILFIFIMTPS
jgi:hypothetical protein